MATVPFTLRLDAELKKSLEEEALQDDRSASYLATKAIESMLAGRREKRRLIEEALVEAEKGEFVSREAVHEWMDSWGTDCELPAPKRDVYVRK